MEKIILSHIQKGHKMLKHVVVITGLTLTVSVNAAFRVPIQKVLTQHKQYPLTQVSQFAKHLSKQSPILNFQETTTHPEAFQAFPYQQACNYHRRSRISNMSIQELAEASIMGTAYGITITFAGLLAILTLVTLDQVFGHPVAKRYIFDKKHQIELEEIETHLFAIYKKIQDYPLESQFLLRLSCLLKKINMSKISHQLSYSPIEDVVTWLNETLKYIENIEHQSTGDIITITDNNDVKAVIQTASGASQLVCIMLQYVIAKSEKNNKKLSFSKDFFNYGSYFYYLGNNQKLALLSTIQNKETIEEIITLHGKHIPHFCILHLKKKLEDYTSNLSIYHE